MKSQPQTHPSTFTRLTEQAHVPLGVAMTDNMAPLMEMGLRDPVGQRLGNGAFGAAYEIPARGRSVLKFTRDPSEVQASILLVNKAPKHIVHIYGVWALARTFDPLVRGWYVIHRDYLTPMSKHDQMLVDVIFELYGDESLDLTIPRRKQFAMMDKWRAYIRNFFTNEDGVEVRDDEGSRVQLLSSGKLIGRTMDLLAKIGDAVKEMHKYGIDWEDIHSGNIMRNAAGRLVIADVGYGLMHNDFDHTVAYLTTDEARSHLAQFVDPPAAAK